MRAETPVQARYDRKQRNPKANRGVCRWEASRQTVGNRGQESVATPSLRGGGACRSWSGSRNALLLSDVWHPTSTNLADVENGPMANLGGPLISLYEAFQGGETSSAALAKQFPLDQFKGDSVLVGLTAYTDFQGFKTSLSNLGMQIVDTNPTDGLVDGCLPINELPTAAQLPQTLSGQPDLKSVTYRQPPSTRRITRRSPTWPASSSASTAPASPSASSATASTTWAAMPRTSSTGDLPTERRTSSQDSRRAPPVGTTKAGRWPRTSTTSPRALVSRSPPAIRHRPAFAQNILALANTAGAKVIVDDLGFADEPFFQPGLITQAINTVTAQGVTYLLRRRQRGRPRLPVDLPRASPARSLAWAPAPS